MQPSLLFLPRLDQHRLMDAAAKLSVRVEPRSNGTPSGVRRHNQAMRLLSGVNDISRLPEFSVVVFALLLNYPWEFLQVPLFADMAQAAHWDAIRTCTRATLGDAVIMLIAYWTVSLVARDRSWVLVPSTARTFIFAATGVVITIAIEMLAVAGIWLGGWRYSSLMPVVPGIGVGLSPLLQWVVLPPLVVWFSRRQILGSSR